jgi:hypothetical protein
MTIARQFHWREYATYKEQACPVGTLEPARRTISTREDDAEDGKRPVSPRFPGSTVPFALAPPILLSYAETKL